MQIIIKTKQDLTGGAGVGGATFVLEPPAEPTSLIDLTWSWSRYNQPSEFERLLLDPVKVKPDQLPRFIGHGDGTSQRKIWDHHQWVVCRDTENPANLWIVSAQLGLAQRELDHNGEFQWGQFRRVWEMTITDIAKFELEVLRCLL